MLKLIISKDFLFFYSETILHYQWNGVTISGGEPLLQIDFVINLLEGNDIVLLKASHGIHLDRVVNKIIEKIKGKNK